ncbi:hypothetical protein FHS41_008293 [Streptomyces violarus]|uniref:Uncharacterized protein n=1 Tax=Streptomyces violarus TaxID=67380 RepID=A0A7W5F6B8_9ACTN|nr:hypothetical protein [Streptomyces violarus]MBB3081735.1 hypothetical protein [Streptomyces violarus]
MVVDPVALRQQSLRRARRSITRGAVRLAVLDDRERRQAAEQSHGAGVRTRRGEWGVFLDLPDDAAVLEGAVKEVGDDLDVDRIDELGPVPRPTPTLPINPTTSSPPTAESLPRKRVLSARSD